MAKNFTQVGHHLTLPVDEGVKSGDVVKVGDIVGVALTDAKTDGTDWYTTLAIDGVWALPATGLKAGDAATVDGNKVGYATEDTDGDTTNVLIWQGL